MLGEPEPRSEPPARGLVSPRPGNLETSRSEEHSTRRIVAKEKHGPGPRTSRTPRTPRTGVLTAKPFLAMFGNMRLGGIRNFRSGSNSALAAGAARAAELRVCRPVHNCRFSIGTKRRSVGMRADLGLAQPCEELTYGKLNREPASLALPSAGHASRA